MRAHATVWTATEAPVLVHLAIHHEVVTGYRIAAVPVDRTQAQSHPRAGRQGDAGDGDFLGGDPGDDRS